MTADSWRAGSFLSYLPTASHFFCHVCTPDYTEVDGHIFRNWARAAQAAPWLYFRHKHIKFMWRDWSLKISGIQAKNRMLYEISLASVRLQKTLKKYHYFQDLLCDLLIWKCPKIHEFSFRKSWNPTKIRLFNKKMQKFLHISKKSITFATTSVTNILK